MLSIIQGATFQAVGAFQLDGAPADMTGWAATAQIHDLAGVALIANLTATWVDPTQGLIQLTAGSTSAWQLGRARIDASLRDPTGAIYISAPSFLRIVETPIE